MTYIVIEDFKAGLDRRKMPEASPPGTLQKLVNGHITRGGEIEKRRAMVPIHALPAGETFGLCGANGKLYTFGSSAGPNVPPGIIYQQLAHPDGANMEELIRAVFFNGKIFAAARYNGGETYAFYDGVRVEHWDAGSGHIVDGAAVTDLMTVRDKVYASFGSVVAFSGIAEPTKWDVATTGASYINMSNQASGSEALTAMGRYQDLMSVFARRTTQIWFLDPDPAQNVQRQVLDNVGTISPKTVVSFGQLDLFFLSDTGVRSLRARDSSNQASISDIGTPIDDILVDYMDDLPEQTIQRATAVMDPRDGRYVLSLGQRTFAFSYYPSVRISAWSEYDFGFPVDEYVSMDGRIYARGGDTVYLLGGQSGTEYDDSTVEVVLPYIDGREVATFKNFKGLDIVAEGLWEVYYNTDPEQPNAMPLVAKIDGTSVGKMKLGLAGRGPLVRLRLVNKTAEPARLSKVIVHYDSAETG